MEVILKEAIEKLGRAGDIVKVKDGYARNYLLPLKKALAATPQNIEWNKSQEAARKALAEKERAEFQELALKIEAASIEIKAKAGDEEKLFGSVTSQEIAKALKDAGFEIDKKKIHLQEPIKTLGNFEVPVKFSAEVSAKVKVSVVKK